LNEETLAHWGLLRKNKENGSFGVLHFTGMERGFFVEEKCEENLKVKKTGLWNVTPLREMEIH